MRVRITTVSELGAIVRRERRRAGLRQDDLALASGTGRRFISELERGKPTVRLDSVLEVLSALGVKVELAGRGDDG
ncbi:MAG: type II toxin-antitoxin system Y4mF family antitoxin [Thermoleophilaceae bacterium]